MLKRNVGAVLVFALSLVLIMAACSGQQGAPATSEAPSAKPAEQKAAGPSVADIIKAAEQEGEVTWTSTLKDDEAEGLMVAFRKAYPKIKISHERDHGTEAQERLLRELLSGSPEMSDVAQIHYDYEEEFRKAGQLEAANWSDFKVIPQLIEPDNLMVLGFSLPHAIVYNTNLVKKEEAPKTWDDLLDPKWNAKVVVDTRPTALVCLATAWGPEKVLEYAKKLGQTKPIFVRGQTETMNLMAAGEYALHSTGLYSSAVYVAQKGGPLAWNFPDPVPAEWGKLAIFKKAKHPNAAKVFLGWLASEGYKVMDEINPGRSVPFGGTLLEQETKGKKIVASPKRDQVADLQAFQGQIVDALGAPK